MSYKSAPQGSQSLTADTISTEHEWQNHFLIEPAAFKSSLTKGLNLTLVVSFPFATEFSPFAI